MIIVAPPVIVTPEPVLASRIDIGMVFTGDLWEFHQLRHTGSFLKIHGHVVCLDTNLLYGAGATSTVRVVNYRSWPESRLEIK